MHSSRTSRIKTLEGPVPRKVYAVNSRKIGLAVFGVLALIHLLDLVVSHAPLRPGGLSCTGFVFVSEGKDIRLHLLAPLLVAVPSLSGPRRSRRVGVGGRTVGRKGFFFLRGGRCLGGLPSFKRWSPANR